MNPSYSGPQQQVQQYGQQRPAQGNGPQYQPPQQAQQGYSQPRPQAQPQQQAQQQGQQYGGGQQSQQQQSAMPPAQYMPPPNAQNIGPQQSPALAGFKDTRWQNPQQGYQSYQGAAPTMPTAPAQAPSQMPSVEQLGLQGGGDPNSVQNLMKALSMVGAGGNNAAMSGLGPSSPPPTQGPLLGAPAGYTGSAGQVGYSGLYAPLQNGGANVAPPPQPGSGYNADSGSGPAIGPGGGSGANGNWDPSMGFNTSTDSYSSGGFGQFGVDGTPQYGQAVGGASAGMVPNTGMLVSDERAKTAIAPAGDKSRSLLDTIGAWEYEYKDPEQPGAGRGKFFGPMAQELQRDEVGRSAVIETPRGLMVDGGRLAAINLSVSKDLHDRISRLEEGAVERRKRR